MDRQGRFRFDYTDLSQLIVGVGARVWSYDPDLAQVTVRDVDITLGSTPAVLLVSVGGCENARLLGEQPS